MSDRQNDVLAAIDAETTKCICGRTIPADGPSLDYCSEDCQEDWQEQQRTYNLPGRVALRRAATSVQLTTRVMWVPGDPPDLAQGVDLTPYLTRIDLGPSDARSTT